MSILQRKQLKELSLETTDVIVIGIIIGKTECRIFQSKNSTEFRGVITFTVRDSLRHFTNCKFWGTQETVENYEKLFKINDIINIYSPKIIPISINNTFEKIFNPLTSTPFSLVINEGIGQIKHHPKENLINLHDLKLLFNIPIKPLTGSLNLADVHSNGLQNAGDFVDLLVIVGRLKPIRSVRTKSGDDRQCLEVIFLDKSFTGGIVLTIWHKDWIERAQQFWMPLQTVIQLIDARVGYSTFYKSTVLGLSGRTLLVENPKGKETDALLLFASTVSLADIDNWGQGGYELPSAESITTIMTVQQIYDRANGTIVEIGEMFTAVLYAMVTKLDLDGTTRIIGKKCKFCKRKVLKNQEYCNLEQCQMSVSFNNNTGDKFEYFFDINLHLTDHTGTLLETYLSGNYAEKFLGYTIEEFQNLSDDRKTSLKWKYLMERFAVKMIVKKKSAVRATMSIIVVEMEAVEIDDVVDKILVY